jgi:hypothetical protein
MMSFDEEIKISALIIAIKQNHHLSVLDIASRTDITSDHASAKILKSMFKFNYMEDNKPSTYIMKSFTLDILKAFGLKMDANIDGQSFVNKIIESSFIHPDYKPKARNVHGDINACYKNILNGLPKDKDYSFDNVNKLEKLAPKVYETYIDKMSRSCLEISDKYLNRDINGKIAKFLAVW